MIAKCLSKYYCSCKLLFNYWTELKAKLSLLPIKIDKTIGIEFEVSRIRYNKNIKEYVNRCNLYVFFEVFRKEMYEGWIILTCLHINVSFTHNKKGELIILI